MHKSFKHDTNKLHQATNFFDTTKNNGFSFYVFIAPSYKPWLLKGFSTLSHAIARTNTEHMIQK